MSASRDSTRLQWSREILPRLAVPSWLLSLFVHASLLGVFFYTAEHKGLQEGDQEAFHEVGLALKPLTGETEGETTEEPVEQEMPAEPIFREPFAPIQEPALAAPERPPVQLELPERDVVGLGTGPLFPGSPRGSHDPVKYSASPRPAGAAGPMGPKTDTVQFFGSEGKGKSFVFVIDASASMGDSNAIIVARAELMRSIEQLDSSQTFQVIFYNDRQFPMQTPGEAPKLLPANQINRTLGRNHIDNIRPDGGTQHFPALQRALEFKPDVIFFLTDAGEPSLTPAELNAIQRLNRGRTQINTILFAKGSDLGPENFLQKLARQNGGIYAHRDLNIYLRRP